MNPPRHSSFMRRQAVAFELGVSRHTLARIIKGDHTFPPFFAISPGVEVIERSDFDTWLLRKRHAALVGAQLATS